MPQVKDSKSDFSLFGGRADVHLLGASLASVSQNLHLSLDGSPSDCARGEGGWFPDGQRKRI